MSQWRVYFTAALVAGIVAVLATGGPAIAHGVRHALFAHNAGKVDGKSAVGAGASVQARKGKLVATSPGTGLLPNTIIQQAPDANLLDGSTRRPSLRRSEGGGRRAAGQPDSSAFVTAAARRRTRSSDGRDSTWLVQGSGTLVRERLNLNAGQSHTLNTPLSTMHIHVPTNLANAGSGRT